MQIWQVGVRLMALTSHNLDSRIRAQPATSVSNMAASYWASNAAHQLLTPSSIIDGNAQDKLLGLPHEQISCLKTFFCQCISDLGAACRLRQRVISTAVTYFRRVYSSHSLCRADPRLLYVTCLYLAAKAEETSIAAKHVIATARKLPNNMLPQHYDMKEVLDAEVALLEALDFVLLIPNPYVDLTRLLTACSASKQLACAAWGMLNDAYLISDLCIMHAPFMVAAACLVIAAASQGTNLAPWMHSLQGLDTELLHGVVMELTECLRCEAMSSALTAEEVHRQLELMQLAVKVYTAQPKVEDGAPT